MTDRMFTFLIVKLIVLTAFLLILAPIMAPSMATAAAIHGQVVGVTDGDTITVLTRDKRQVKVRLYGIDCPEARQAFGQRAKQATSDAVFGKPVDLVVLDTDRYGRKVAIVRYDGQVLQDVLLKAGMAWVYGRYCKDGSNCNRWRRLEQEAKTKRVGLWADKAPVSPWEWRRGNR